MFDRNDTTEAEAKVHYEADRSLTGRLSRSAPRLIGAGEYGGVRTSKAPVYTIAEVIDSNATTAVALEFTQMRNIWFGLDAYRDRLIHDLATKYDDNPKFGDEDIEFLCQQIVEVITTMRALAPLKLEQEF